jgi:pimeloyl-ACP methyl ester carboxylesterase
MDEMRDENPKSETRSPREIRRKKIRNGHSAIGSAYFGFRIFRLPSDFWFRISGFFIFCILLPGCSTPAPPPATRPVPVLLHPYLLHLPGIGGTRKIDTAMITGLKQGGYVGQVDIYDWTENDRGLMALVDDARHRREAKIIAQKLTDQFDHDPASPIYLTSHSGGAGLAVWALEDLPDRVKIKTLLFLAPALSPSYDLSKALAHVSHRAYAFTSQDDIVLLACRWSGTVDGVKTDGAGRVGFTKPPAGDEQQYAKLIQFPYQEAWIQLGDRGDHVGPMSRRFSRAILAPLLLSDTLPASNQAGSAGGFSPAPTSKSTSQP